MSRHGRHAKADKTRVSLAVQSRLAFQILCVDKQKSRTFGNKPALGCQCDSTAIPIKQPGAELPLQCLDRAAQGGLGNAQFIGRAHKIESPREYDEMAKASQFEHIDHTYKLAPKNALDAITPICKHSSCKCMSASPKPAGVQTRNGKSPLLGSRSGSW